jgi:tripartite-type tricarboxylate transporter receptor subunit TctC
MATVSTTAANPAINPKIAYNPLTDFTPIINVAATPNVIAVHPSFPARDYKGFLAEIKKNPGKYSFASSGTGGIGHLQMELFKNLSGTFITHIPYRGVAPATMDMIAGHIQLVTGTIPALLPFIKDGRVRALAVTSAKRSAALPDVPSMTEAGLAGIDVVNFFALMAPAGTPPAIVNQLNAAINKAVALPEVTARFKLDAIEAAPGSPALLGAFIEADYRAWRNVVRTQKLVIDSV